MTAPSIADEAKAADESKLRLEGIVATAMDGIISVDDDQRIVLFNPAAEAMFGLSADEALGQDLSRFVPERYREAHAEHIRRFLAGGATNQLMRSRGANQQARTVTGLRLSGVEFPMEASISQIDVAGSKYATVIVRDVTERLADEEARLLLAREVDHRAKNALAVVQALVSLTRAATTEEFIDAVHARVAALARSHSLLARNRWEGVDLNQILIEETTPYERRGQVDIQGAGVMLRAGSVEPVSLLIHELATNAAKYGALSVASGRVAIRTVVSADNELEISWSETGGPPVRKPEKNGFGTTLMDQVITRQLGGSLDVRWPPDGLRVVARLPSAVQRLGAGGDILDRTARPMIAAPSAHRNASRVLVVEDEALVAMQLGDELTGLGWQVLGPAVSIEEAIRLLDEGPRPDVAVLDVNLRGRLVYPLAERLRSEGVALVFCTGYEQVDFKYRDCAVVRKPVKAELLDLELRRLTQSSSNDLNASE